jgi:hypothetical protein
MRVRAILSLILTINNLMLLFLLLIVILSGCEEQPQEQDVELKEISAFDVPDELQRAFSGLKPNKCSEIPDPNVHEYPSFVSDKPLFGSVHLPRGYCQEFRGRWYHYAIDQTDPASKSYDTLYFDTNCDLDLTNDKLFKVQQDPPKGAENALMWLKHQVCFDYLNLEFPFGQETQALEIMPKFIINEDGNRCLSLVTTKAFNGKVNIAGQSYDIWLGHNFVISGWFDHPSTALHLILDGNFEGRNPISPNFLMEWRRIGKTDYRFSASPSGDKLIVRPYQGKYGTIEVAPVNKRIKRARMSGALFSGEAMFFLDGKQDKYGYLKPVPSSRIPVGDYTASLDFFLDDLRIGTSANSHTDGCWRSQIEVGPSLQIRIREDESFVLDFSNKPEVIFTSPQKGLRLRPGEQLQVQPILLDPKLDIMITEIQKEAGFNLVPQESDLPYLVSCGITSGVSIAILLLLSVFKRSKRRVLLVLAGLVTVITVGSAVAYCTVNIEMDYVNILPCITIARSNGEIVASGVAPFT